MGVELSKTTKQLHLCGGIIAKSLLLDSHFPIAISTDFKGNREKVIFLTFFLL